MGVKSTNADHIVDTYLDSSEKFLFDFFDQPQSKKEDAINKELVKEDLSWPIRYHLSPRREMLLNWFPFKRKSSLLEIGAGCGAVTNAFIDKVDLVVTNELSPSRAKVIKRRYSDKKNLEVHEGDILNYKKDTKFDYVTLIGVLEYAGTYFKNTGNPYLDLLIKTKRLLAKDGSLILAIENKLGLKYLTGSPEDHLGVPFVGLENYPQSKSILTFTRDELTELLQRAGFSKIDFYYPFPDYKFTHIVFSEEGLSLIDNFTKAPILQTVDLSSDKQPIFNEASLGYTLAKEGLLSEFSNSFLVTAK